jgi:hypothetical protein
MQHVEGNPTKAAQTSSQGHLAQDDAGVVFSHFPATHFFPPSQWSPHAEQLSSSPPIGTHAVLPFAPGQLFRP